MIRPLRALALGLVSLLAVAPPLPGPNPPVQIELILDASNSMWTKLEDGRPRITAAKQVLTDFVAGTADSPDLNIGLRIYGSQIRVGQPRACEDSQLFVPIRGFDRAALLKTIRDARAIGSTPIARSLELAAADLKALPAGGKVSVLLVTDGEETCGGNVAAAITTLKAAGANVDFRIIGIGLSAAAVKRFSDLAPIENANSGAALAQAIGRALKPAVPAAAASPKATGVRVTLVRDGQPANLAGAQVALGTSRQPQPIRLAAGEPGVFTAQVAPGGYTPLLTLPGMAAPREFAIVSVTAGGRNEFVLDLTEPRAFTVKASPARVKVADRIKVEYAPAAGTTAPAAGGKIRLLVAPPGSGDETELASADATAASGSVEIIAPDFEGNVEVRCVVTEADRTLVVGRSNLVAIFAAPATLKVPPTVEAGAIIPIEWTGPGLPDDYLTLGRTIDGNYIEYDWRRLGAEKTITLTAPFQTGDAEVSYMVAESGRVAAKAKLKIVAANLTLTAPAEVTAGDLVPVKFSGKGKGDALTFVKVEMPVEEYGDFWGRPNDEGETVLTAPLEAGNYEIRQIAGGGILLAKQAVRIVASRATLDAPATVIAGSTILIKWTGPRGRGAWITIVEPGASESSYGAYQTTAEGTSPLELAAPGEPGEYEIRFVIGDTKVVAKRRIRVTR